MYVPDNDKFVNPDKSDQVAVLNPVTDVTPPLTVTSEYPSIIVSLLIVPDNNMDVFPP